MVKITHGPNERPTKTIPWIVEKICDLINVSTKITEKVLSNLEPGLVQSVT